MAWLTASCQDIHPSSRIDVIYELIHPSTSRSIQMPRTPHTTFSYAKLSALSPHNIERAPGGPIQDEIWQQESKKRSEYFARLHQFSACSFSDPSDLAHRVSAPLYQHSFSTSCVSKVLDPELSSNANEQNHQREPECRGKRSLMS